MGEEPWPFVLLVCLSTFKVPTVSPHLRPRTRSYGCSKDPLISQPDSPGKGSPVCSPFWDRAGSSRPREDGPEVGEPKWGADAGPGGLRGTRSRGQEELGEVQDRRGGEGAAREGEARRHWSRRPGVEGKRVEEGRRVQSPELAAGPQLPPRSEE